MLCWQQIVARQSLCRGVFTRRASTSVLGGLNLDLLTLGSDGSFSPLTGSSSADRKALQNEFEYDLAVIGGGSGGLATAKEAARLGAKVLLCDFVKPTPLGTQWGLGGTCVNVGCIPKKLMHQAALIGEVMKDAPAFGWEMPAAKPVMVWESMVKHVQNHIKSLNFKYRVELDQAMVTYENGLARFPVGTDGHTIETVCSKGNIRTVTAANVVVAVGGRPTPLDCAGSEWALSSDDLFSISSAPRKTCIIGGSYIALECAGFLAGFGYDVTVLVRSILLRGFDRDCAERIERDLTEKGVKFLYGVVPESIEETSQNRKQVTWKSSGNDEVDCLNVPHMQRSDVFDTVFAAVGRSADTSALGLDAVGVQYNLRNGKIFANAAEQTSVPHIYAIGDVMEGCPELTPVAIQAGRTLAKRLFQHDFHAQTDYHHIPTTVFTPLEYGTIGFSEEDALDKLGADNVEVYHRIFSPLEWSLPNHRPDNLCYAKLICSKLDDMRIVGLHFCGPNAGEVAQGWTLAMKLGATFDDFSSTVGIHPTNAEEFTIMSVTKASGESAEGGGC